jgi:Bifunctional DNA primase/polymerase, N-terminal
MNTIHQPPDEPLNAALRYAAAGWPVFPCKPGLKEPATPHGFKDATTDPGQIRRWWTRCPAFNVAVATGAPGPDVLDVDVHPGGSGFEAFNQLKRAGLLTGTKAIIRTPSGGLHIYFDGTDQANGRLTRHHLDFRGLGGYVLVPPSAVGGRPYELVDKRTAAGRLDWKQVRGLLDPPRPAAPRPTGGDIGHLVRWVAGLAEGNRNSGLFWAACRAIDLGGLDLGGLVDAAVRAGLTEVEARRTVSSAERQLTA